MLLSLESKTLEYWCLSQCWTDVSSADENMTTGDALSILTNICENLNPERPLALRVYVLRDQIIEGGKRTHG